VENQNAEVEEEENHENDLRNELANDVDFLLEKFVVPIANRNSEKHVNNTNDDWHFHFVGVEELDLIFGYL